MSASDELRNLAESWAMSGDIPSYVKHDLDTLAIDVSEIERERDERRIVTAQEHGRVVQVYIDMLANKNEENARLRELVRDVWDVALHPETFGGGSHLLRRMCELGIEVE